MMVSSGAMGSNPTLRPVVPSRASPSTHCRRPSPVSRPVQGRAAPTRPSYQKGLKLTTVPVCAAWMMVSTP